MSDDVAAPPPVWDAIAHDVLCPLCEYNLRGLSEPRCPECGYRFAWADVTDPTTRVHPYLFEHHPRRNVWSFVRTLRGTLRPRRFWSSLSPTHPLRPKRLRIYWGVTLALALLGVVGVWGRATFNWWGGVQASWFVYPPISSPALAAPAEFSWDMLRESAAAAWQVDASLSFALRVAIFWAIWPWVTLGVLMIFRTSMRRAKVKTGHVVRCLVYSFDVGAWLGPAIGAIALFSIVGATGRARAWGDGVVGLAMLAVVVLMTVRLRQAYRWYLRFDHPFWTIVASQVIVFLMLLVVIVNV